MKRITLEVSLKPFRDRSDESIRRTCQDFLRQWQSLIHQAEAVSFLLWTADGSEILDYNKVLDDEIEWAKWLGIANGPWATEPPYHLHNTRTPYCENPPKLTYRILRTIVRTLKEETFRGTGKPVAVGTTFDPGPEFAESSFKYTRHKEICKGGIMGGGKWVHCAAVLDGDTRAYAGFPDGIPDGTTLGTFLGRQAQHFLTDLGFDYLWLSNGFGYSLDSWNVTGEVFDGKTYDTSKAANVRETILHFWSDFRKECSRFKIETRGSNLSTGMDLSSDASPVREIYRGGFNLVAPVNSPWAALDGDYGLELVGWLSHIAELPAGSLIPFRYYIHDPWWINSPWLDRYGREPHDIYLPLSIGRIDEKGKVSAATSIALLSIDDSRGRTPEVVSQEVIPHIQRAIADAPDEPGLLTWIYPFDEYHDWTFGTPNRVDEVFFGDWFMRAAINQGFPLNTIVSTANFSKALAANPGLYNHTVLVSPAPDSDTKLAQFLMAHVENGGRVLLYGPLRHADSKLLQRLDLEIGSPLSGILQIQTTLDPDTIRSGSYPPQLKHRGIVSGGGIDTLLPKTTRKEIEVMAQVSSGNEKRAYAIVHHGSNGGKLAWVRGTLCEEVSTHLSLPKKDDPSRWFSAERLMRWILQKLGIRLQFDNGTLTTPDPLILAARHRNGLFFSGYTASTNSRLAWSFPEGVPVPVGCDVEIAHGVGQMNMPRAWHRECRVFVRQTEAGEISCRECLSGAVDIERRLMITGLNNATVTFLHDSSAAGRPVHFQEQGDIYLGQGKEYLAETLSPHQSIVSNITGTLLISW